MEVGSKPASSSNTTEDKGRRGIPKAPFIADVGGYLEGKPSAAVALKEFQDALAKYRYMESNLAQRKAGFEEKIPDIRKTHAMVKFLDQRRKSKEKASEDDLDEEDGANDNEPLVTTFELNDTLCTEAVIEDTDEVYLWLGADVMLSYPISEALELLSQKLSAAESSLEGLIEDMEWLKEQITVMEVNVARVYNWDVKTRREARLMGEDKGEKG